jgi:hypothetical protein
MNTLEIVDKFEDKRKDATRGDFQCRPSNCAKVSESVEIKRLSPLQAWAVGRVHGLSRNRTPFDVPHRRNTEELVWRDVTSVTTCRDARCNETLFLSDARLYS